MHERIDARFGKRFAAIPEVPTFDEQGTKGYEASTWFGFMVSAKTPPDVVTELNTETGKVLAGKEIRERYQVESLEPALPCLTYCDTLRASSAFRRQPWLSEPY